MGKYYYLLAGLPHLPFEGFKPPFTLTGFREQLAEHLTKADARLLENLTLKTENKNLLEQLRNPDFEQTEGGKITAGEINTLVAGIQTETESIKAREAYYKIEYEDYYDKVYNKVPKPKLKPFKNHNKRLPVYFEPFVRIYLKSVENEEKVIIPWEDRLSALYFEFVMKCSNSFLASWFELNLNINNIYTALTCRKYKLDRANYIVGNTEISNKLRISDARDFDLGESLDCYQTVARIAEDTDWLQRELKTDQLRWEWLDEQTFPQVFDIENVISYWIKIEMLEHWSGLDNAAGDKAFREIVGVMKKGSDHVLEEFKRNNKK